MRHHGPRIGNLGWLVAILLVGACGGTSAESPAPSTPAVGVLTGVTWHMVSFDDGAGTLVDVVPGSDPTAVFDAAGTVTGNATCNTYSGPAVVSGTAIKVGPLATTKMACADAMLNAQESAYLAALESSVMFDVGAMRLELGNAAGALTVVFEKR
jgi:heat shock protein HslJ